MYKYHVMLKDRIPYLERDSDTKYEEVVLDNPSKMQKYIEDVFHIKCRGGAYGDALLKRRSKAGIRF